MVNYILSLLQNKKVSTIDGLVILSTCIVAGTYNNNINKNIPHWMIDEISESASNLFSPILIATANRKE